MPKKLVETAHITTEAAAAAKATGRMLIQFISPGWGSSGYYSDSVLEQAVTDKVIPAGTHMYADHPTDVEDQERPVRSIKDLMAVTTEDAYLGDDGALVGEARVVPSWRDLVETVKDQIGVSIRGSATDIVEGEAEGRTGGIIEGLVAPVLSVDFVTRAGRGGRVLQVMESAAANGRAISNGVAEATVNDTREQLQQVLRDAYDVDYLWVRDFDDTTVWFEVEAENDNGVYAQSYSTTDDVVALTGDRTEVRVVTNYVPVAAPPRVDPVNPAGTTTEASEEDTMGKIQIEEAVHADLVEKAGRVDALTSERDTLKAENTGLKESAAADARRTAAVDLIREHAHGFTPLEVKGLVADLPLTEAGEIDAEEFGKTLDKHATESSTGGHVSGFGATTDTDTVTESAPTRTRTPWGRSINEQKGA